MNLAVALIVGALIAFAFTAWLSDRTEVGGIAAAEFLALSAMLLLLRWMLNRFNILKMRVSTYAICGVALLVVIYVSLSTAGG